MLMAVLSRSPQGDAQTGSTGLVVTESNLNPVLQVITWLLLAITTLMLAFRFLTSFFLKSKRTPGLEDIFIIVSYVCFHFSSSLTPLTFN